AEDGQRISSFDELRAQDTREQRFRTAWARRREPTGSRSRPLTLLDRCRRPPFNERPGRALSDVAADPKEAPALSSQSGTTRMVGVPSQPLPPINYERSQLVHLSRTNLNRPPGPRQPR